MFVFPQDAISENSSEWTHAKEDIFLRNFPLHQTCRDGEVSKLSTLINCVSNVLPYKTEYGSLISLSLSAEDPFYGWMPAHWAAYFGKLECLRMVIETSRHVDVPSHKHLQTPTHMAAFSGNVFCLQWLLDYGADPMRWDYLKETPLHKAARTGSLEALSLLVSRGARLSWKNVKGETAADLAASLGHKDAAFFLKQQAQMTQDAAASCKESLKNGNTVLASNGYYGFQPSIPAEDFMDVFLCPQVTRNEGSVGGRKRSREDFDRETSGKRFCAHSYHEDEMEVNSGVNEIGKEMSGSRCTMPYYM